MKDKLKSKILHSAVYFDINYCPMCGRKLGG